MEFDKSKVYTAVNADELKIGSKVLVADNFSSLMSAVACYRDGHAVHELTNIFDTTYERRFEVDHMDFANSLVYLIEEKKLKWTDLKVGDIIRNNKTDMVTMITAINPNPTSKLNLHICCGYGWIYDSQFKNDWEIVNHSSINYVGNLPRETWEEEEES